MDSVIHTIYMSGVIASMVIFLSILLVAMATAMAMTLIIYVDAPFRIYVDAPFRTHSRKVAGITVICTGLAIVIAATVVVFLPSCSTHKVTVTAKIATALADRNLSQPERDYLQKLAASYSLKSEAAK